MSRILIWTPGYTPELLGIPPLVSDAATWLSGRGHRVEVVAPHPNNPDRRIRPEYRGCLWRSELREGVAVHRSWLRVRPRERFLDKALWELSYATCSLPLIARRLRRADVLCCVIPSLLAAIYAHWLLRALPARRRPRLVLWLQDLVLRAALTVEGAPAQAPRLLSLVAGAEQGALGAADRLIACSPGFRAYLSERGVREERLVVIPNWIDTRWIVPAPASQNGTSARFLYAGNLGYTQGFETLLEAARLAGPALEVEIVGAGNALEQVRRLAQGQANVRLRPPVARADYPRLLAAADVHLLVQRRLAAGANLPSKIASYLASGRPILAAVDPHSAAAELLRQSGGALLVPPEQPAELARAMRALAAQPSLRARLGQRGRAFATRELDREQALARLEQVLCE